MAPSPLTRVRHPLRYRRLHVQHVSRLTPRVRRLVVGGPELEGFVSPGFDDHVKLFFPDDAGLLPDPLVGPDRLTFPDVMPPPGRDFTPRSFDPERLTLTLDIGVHGTGPAARWAAGAEVGSPLGVAGPRGSSIVDRSLAWNLLVGDETAVPAIARRLDEAPAGLVIVALVAIDDAVEEQSMASRAQVDLRWLPGDGSALDTALASVTLPSGDGFAWVAGERDMVRRVRTHLIEERGLAPARIKAAAYWQRGTAGRHEVIED